MDPNNAGLPCIVQALASMDPNANDVDLPCIVQALTALPPSPPPKTPGLLVAAAKDQPPRTPDPSRTPLPPSPRRTRSGGAPEWTAAETLALVAAVAAVDDGWARSVSAFQKWTIVAENLASSEATGGGSSRRSGRRAAGECRRRWEALAAEYAAVRRWEVRTGGRYWEMGAAVRRKAVLPADFDAEVYGIMDALMRVEEALLAEAGGACGGRGEEEMEGLVGAGTSGGGGCDVGFGEEDGAEDGVGEDGEGDDNEEMDGGNGNASDALAISLLELRECSDSTPEGCEMKTSNEPKKSQIDAWELANKLNENAQHIHMILKGEADEDAGHNHPAPAYAISSPDAMEMTRQKADDLIKSLGGLVGYLNQFTDLIKENGFEDVIGMS